MKVRQVAELAKLALSPDEERRMEGELESILCFVRQMQGVNDPAASAQEQANVLRQDAVHPSMDRDVLLAAAPSRVDGYISVPKTFD